MSVCAVETCDLPVEDAHVCTGCGRRLELALGDVPGLVHELNTNLTKQSVMGGESLGGHMKQTVAPLPYDANASTISDVLRSTLAGWVRLVSEEKYDGARDLPDDRVSAMAGWLQSEVEWLRHHEAAAEAVDEITSVVKAVRRAVDRPADRVFVGICSTVHAEVECTEPLYAKQGAYEVRCRVCGATHQVDERREILKAAVEDVLATPAEITRAVAWLGDHVRKNQITRWVQGDRLVARATHGLTGKPIYRIGDVLDLLATRSKAG